MVNAPSVEANAMIDQIRKEVLLAHHVRFSEASQRGRRSALTVSQYPSQAPAIMQMNCGGFFQKSTPTS
jgi:hypothetical protein